LTEPTEKAPSQEKEMTAKPIHRLEGLHGTPPSKEIPLPVFEARNTQNQPRLPTDLIGKPTILWFFPFAATPGWTKEGCGYRDLQSEFDALGIRIVAVGFNSVRRQGNWKKDQRYQFEVWKDLKNTLAIHYGAAKRQMALYPDRISRLLDAQGNVLLEYNDVKVGTHPKQVLEDCQKVFSPWGSFHSRTFRAFRAPLVLGIERQIHYTTTVQGLLLLLKLFCWRWGKSCRALCPFALFSLFFSLSP
jgi:peroxiredoxin Q/BCP